MTSPAFVSSSPLALPSTRSTFVPSSSALSARRSSRCLPRVTPRATATAPTSSTSDAPLSSADKASPRLLNLLDQVPPEFRSSLLRLPEDAEITELGARHTKIIATVGPSTCSPEHLLRLVAGGVAIIRLNLSHGDLSWHRRVIEDVRKINLSTPFVAAVMLDVGSFDSIRLGEFSRNPVLRKGDEFTLTTAHQPEYPEGVSEVSNDSFINIVSPSDLLQCQPDDADAPVVELLVKDKTSTDARCEVVSPGTLKSRGVIAIRGKSINLSKAESNSSSGASGAAHDEDMNTSIARAVLGCPPDHVQFAINERVEFIALSFVESPEQIEAVKRLLHQRGAQTSIVAKIESENALRNLEAIVNAADGGVMIARGDLGSSIQYERVPYWQSYISQLCRRYGKPCIVSTHFLESMVLYPTPTRAEVTDITETVKQGIDALVLTAETASGRFPFKSISVMNSVLLKSQQNLCKTRSAQTESEIARFSELSSGGGSAQAAQPGSNLFAGAGENLPPPLIKDESWWTSSVGDIAERICECASSLAQQQAATAILVFTQKGLMANLTSRCRPHVPIFAFTATPVVRNRLNLLYGVRPFRIQFQDDPEETIGNAMALLRERGAIAPGDTVVILADVLGGTRSSVPDDQLRNVFNDYASQYDGKTRWMTAGEVRSAIRVLGLKVSDRVEAQLSMRDIDVAEAGKEEGVVRSSSTQQQQQTGDDDFVGQFDFERFKEFAANAKEIVHTLQTRKV